MKSLQVLIVVSFIFLLIACSPSTPPRQFDVQKIELPNGWSLSPAGRSLTLGDLPLNAVVSPDNKYLAVTNNGQSTQSIQLIDAQKQVILDTMEVGKCWLGLAFSDDSRTLYASGGNDNWIYRFDIDQGKLVIRDTIIIGKPWPVKISIAGIALDDEKHLLYTVTKENNSLYIVNLSSKSVVKQLPLGGEGYTCILSPDKKTLYASCWGCDKVKIFDTEKQEMTGEIPVGDNPNDMVINRNGNILFVANANDNSVSVIDLKQGKVIETLNSAIFPDAPMGSTTNSLALTTDDNTLYIANADNNCLAVYDVSSPGKCISKGFIPTGWYPTCVRVTADHIYVTNGKGFSSQANPRGPNPYAKEEEVIYQHGDTLKPDKVQYIGGLFIGTLSIIPTPDEQQLALYSQAVYGNTPYTKNNELQSDGQEGNPIPMKVGGPSPIKYVFYILKENRTYDQVLGDVAEGNGDTTLVLFGKWVTPNQHKLVHDFVLLDNFYVNGEVSADGHNWSMGAYATDYIEKNWPTNYGNRGGTYDSEGSREIANNKGGYIWGLCKRAGVSYRSYGEFVSNYTPNIPVLEGHFCPYFTSFDFSVMDTSRFYQWKRDFDSLLAIEQVPSLNTLRFPNDHTEGLNKGRRSPNADVADNDLAVGMFVDYLSHTPIWNQSVIFITEDDAQNGPDHVDAHRSTVYLAGGYVKRNFVDHTMYSTASILRTIELILGMPPMSQYDAAAESMWRCFNNTPDDTRFEALPANINLLEINMAENEWQRRSEQLNFSMEDRAPDAEFNKVLWAAIKGDGNDCPPPTRSAFIRVNEEFDDD